MPGTTITLPTALTVYRLSTALAALGVQGTAELRIQPSSQNASGKLFVGGSAVSPTNCGYEMEVGESSNSASGFGNQVFAGEDYLTSDVDNFKVNVHWRTV